MEWSESLRHFWFGPLSWKIDVIVLRAIWGLFTKARLKSSLGLRCWFDKQLKQGQKVHGDSERTLRVTVKRAVWCEGIRENIQARGGWAQNALEKTRQICEEFGYDEWTLLSPHKKITQRHINIPIVAAVSPGGGPHNPNVSVPFRALFRITTCQILSPCQLNLHTDVPLSATQEPAWGQELLVRVLFLCWSRRATRWELYSNANNLVFLVL